MPSAFKSYAACQRDQYLHVAGSSTCSTSGPFLKVPFLATLGRQQYMSTSGSLLKQVTFSYLVVLMNLRMTGYLSNAEGYNLTKQLTSNMTFVNRRPNLPNNIPAHHLKVQNKSVRSQGNEKSTIERESECTSMVRALVLHTMRR